MTKKLKIEIKHYLTGKILFEYECEDNTIAKTVQEAVRVSADLSFANLRYANLRFANLRSADLSYADLSYADLSYADLSFANLRSADLSFANLRSADLSYADLSGIAFENLPASWVNLASRDMLFIFQSLKGELPFLREKLINGEVDGSQYKGDCACLVGTLANADGGLEKVCETIPFYDKGTHNPAEAWFLNIAQGDTPEDNMFSKHALMLVDRVLGQDKPKKAKKK